MPDLIGQTLGGYRILSQIGKGGMATVYKAFQPSLERHVAIKVLPAFYAEQDETFIKRFRLEARSIAHLRHPNILTIYEYGEENGVTFIVMEYVQAGTLTERLGQPMALGEVEPILRQVASALSYAHDQGVIHRDVKPSNILLPKPDWPLLTDFGLAKIVGGSTLTLTGTIAGTPAYMSPEQGQGISVDHLSDIYSLGIVLYEMLTGVVPFTAETPMAVIVKHMIEPLPLPRTVNPSLPESVEDVILKALAKQPADRYARADQMAEAFSQAVGRAEEAEARAVAQPVVPAAAAAATTVAQPAPPPAAEARPRRRRVLPLALAGLAALALVALGVVALAGRPGRSPGHLPTTAQGPGGVAGGAGFSTGGETPAATETAAGRAPEPTRTFDQLMADGRAMLDRGDAESAVRDFQQALAADPGNLDAYWEVAGLLRDYGYFDDARRFVDAGAVAGPDEAWHHEAAGWQYFYLEAYEESIPRFQRAIEQDPDSLWSYIGLSHSVVALGDAEAARAPLDVLAAHEPVSEPDLYENLGWGYFELGAYAEAQAAFALAVELDPEKVGAWSGLIEATYNAEGIEPALTVAFEAIAANPEDGSLHHRLGDLAREQGDMAEAESAYRAAMQLDPAYGPGYMALADLYEEEERGDEAVAVLELGIERNPEDAWLHEALGQMLFDWGEAEAAYEHFQLASDLEPSYGWFPLQAAEAYYAFTGDVDGAAALLERAASAQPGDADLLDSIGKLYENMGDCPTAHDYYSRALEINPDIENSQAGLTRCGG